MRHIPSGTIMAVKVSVDDAFQYLTVTNHYIFDSVEDSGNSEHSRAETTVDGSRHFHAIVCLSAHSTVLRSIVHGGRCMDMHGSHGHFTR